MRIKTETLAQIRKDTDCKRELCYQLGISESTLYRHLRDNADDGELTKMKAVKIIALKLGLPESVILTQ